MCEIANKIKARRIELGLTLEEVARAVGVGRSTVRKWETGMIRNMGRDKIAALAGHSDYTFTQTKYQSTDYDELTAIVDSMD